MIYGTVPDMSDSCNWHITAKVGETVFVTKAYTGNGSYTDDGYCGLFVVHSILRSEQGTVTDYKLSRPGQSVWACITHVSRVIPKP